jgi:hypothetical protein
MADLSELIDAFLRQLPRAGWSIYIFGPQGDPYAVCGLLSRGPLTDVLILRGEDDGAVYRVYVGTGPSPIQDVWEPDTVQWYWAGPAFGALVQALTVLPKVTKHATITAPSACRIPEIKRRSFRMWLPSTVPARSLLLDQQ